jgi:hypothetical protein
MPGAQEISAAQLRQTQITESSRWLTSTELDPAVHALAGAWARPPARL